ncbi:STAS domain-containing protein [Methylovulum psychrotolerans]|jgi:anti-anti-sigma factor|uniref:Anti-sigma factor antagonist n=1 Tax=Methylovulum psychrotolerans TaxID=1704499 RepID=A0A1Z4BXU1_9GAMM|nr:STAS domain-containing protein [Methylovulum psychrotolerans]ASF46063.1 anti-anti-sigma factor [Methylovulum psychrotolerans]MBT9099764.1 STAS domain-containing protein [Methylovulum psychrotolerans]POZ50184.1 anti-sigma factor antagonist [Methylovulum psychrotolerans]
MLTISSAPQGNSLVIALAGRIDAANAKNLEQYCLEQIDGGAIRLIFDFTAVNYISSAALRVFLVIAKRLNSLQGSVKLCALNTLLRDVFDISGFAKLFVITATVQEAL